METNRETYRKDICNGMNAYGLCGAFAIYAKFSLGPAKCFQKCTSVVSQILAPVLGIWKHRGRVTVDSRLDTEVRENILEDVWCWYVVSTRVKHMAVDSIHYGKVLFLHSVPVSFAMVTEVYSYLLTCSQYYALNMILLD